MWRREYEGGSLKRQFARGYRVEEGKSEEASRSSGGR